MENCMNYIIKICSVFSILFFTTSIKSFDALQHMHRLFEEDSALLELYTPDNAPALNDPILSDNELEQFDLPLEPWDALLFEDLLEQNISADLSALTPSTSSAYETFLESAPPALQTAASSVLRVQKKSRKKIFTCDHPGCAYATKFKSNLNKHKLAHTGEKPYKCDHPKCNYSTPNKKNLERHMLTHSGEKPYKCDHPECTQSFNQEANLIRHMLTHSGEKPYICDYPECTYTTCDSSALKTHKRVHTKAKSYICDHPGCPFATFCSTRLTNHKRMHSEAKSYICDHPECLFATFYKYSLTRHKKTAHPRALDQESSENKRQRKE